MNTFAIAGISCGISCLILALITLTFGRLKIHRLLAFFNIAVAVWGFGGFIVGIANNEQTAIFGWKFAHIGGMFVSILFFHLVSVFCTKHRKWIIIFGYLQAIFFNFISWIPDKLITKTRFVYGLYYNDATVVFSLAVFSYVILVSLSFWELLNFLKESKGIKREQALYIIFGFLCGFIGGTSTFLPEFKIDFLYPFGNFGIVLYSLVVTYAILRYRILDIKVVLTRAGIFIIVYALILGTPLWLTGWGRHWLQGIFGEHWYWVSVILAIILATLGPFIYLYVNRKAEERLLKEQRRYQDSLKQASIGMTRIRDLRKLLALIAHIVVKTVKISYVGIYLFNKEANEYILQVCRDKGRTPIPKLSTDNYLIRWLVKEQAPLIYEEVTQRAQYTLDNVYKRLEENMRVLTATLITPCMLDNKLVGFFVFGEKISGQMYTPEDLNVFQVLANQAALAIENAQFYEEAKEMHEQIAQAEKMATVGTMADGLSHQINNRFYALALIAADTVDTIKMTDTSNCTPEIKEMVEQINHALERIEANVMQGGEVVKGILKYTRKGDEGFVALNLDQVLDGALDMVQYKIKLSEVDIVREYPKDMPKIKGNLVQLQEAFFNFIDNAYDAIMERRGLLKEPGYRGKIIISSLPQVDGRVGIKVQDNGMGMKNSFQKKVFTPFFTTKASSHKGTGLGLYVIRRIIEENNHGRISFASEYGHGTTFFVELPLAV